ncbi:MAG: gluconate 2-dehydrogenase gamma chain [Polaribacter sp.]
MLERNKQNKNPKFGSLKPKQISALSSGLNRRAFLRNSSATFLVASLMACKPNIETNNTQGVDSQTLVLQEGTKKSPSKELFEFTQDEKNNLIQVQALLFPKDDDGPSAEEINAFTYLEWALTDPDNQADGDGDFIIKGIGWLNGLSKQTQGDNFLKLSLVKQEKVLQQISQSSTGENWMSIIIYYIMEALLFDPIYGGNPDSIGWKWLEHQPGFPAPDSETLYRQFL